MLNQTVIKYCSMFKRDLNYEDIRLFLESSPYYPNLLAVVETLRYVGLDVQAVRCDISSVDEFTGPVLFHIKNKGKESLVIGIIEKSDATLIIKMLNPRSDKWNIMPIETLDKIWDGVVIFVKDKTMRPQIVKKHSVLLICCLIAILILIKFYGIIAFSLLPIGIGLLTAIYPYISSMGERYTVIDRICHISSITDCGRVDKSKFSKVFGIKMSTLSLSFFCTQLVVIALSLLFGDIRAIYSVYLIPALIVIPTAIYSIYGQINVGKICPLCVAILICIIAEAVIFFLMPTESLNIKIVLLWCLVAVTVLWTLHYAAILITRQHECFSNRINLLKLKRRKDILLSESQLNETIDSPVWLGQGNAKIKLMTIISPGCPHCRQLVGEVLSLLDKIHSIRWDIVLGVVSKSDIKTIDNWISQYNKDKSCFIEKLRLWSKSGKPIESLDRPISIESSKVVLETFANIKERLKIDNFPAILLNDRKLSSLYTPEDLKYIISDLIYTR